jgi:AraC-like DNA-binding protein
MLGSGELGKILQEDPRVVAAGLHPQRRVTPNLLRLLHAEYQRGDSLNMLADRHGIHRNSIARALRESGCVIRNQALDEREIERAQQLANDGLSLNEIGRVMGRDPKTIKAVLKLRSPLPERSATTFVEGSAHK